MIDFHWKNEANRWRSEIYLIRFYADSLLKTTQGLYIRDTQHQIPSGFFLWVDGTKTTLEKLNSKSLYESLVSKISCKPIAMKKYDKAFNTDTVHLDWKKIYLLPSKVTLHTRLREFNKNSKQNFIYEWNVI